jgi:hypothetical protein
MEQKQPVGVLFGSIPFYSTEDLTSLIDNLDEKQTKHIITQSLQYAYKSGIFNLLESELISKSVRILNNNDLDQF